MTADFYYLSLSLLRSTLSETLATDVTRSIHRVVPLAWFTTLPIDLPLTSLSACLGTIDFHLMIVCILYYIPFLLLFPYLLFASLCTQISLSSSLICSLVSTFS